LKNALKNLILLLFVVVVLLGLLETALRIVAPQPRSGPVSAPTEMIPAVSGESPEVYHPDLGWFNRPGYRAVLKGPDENESVIAINSNGLREEEVDYEKPPGKKRVIVLGDSFAWGYGLKAEERLSDLLKEEFPGVQMVNMGVVGYSTDQECVLLEKEGLKYRPDGVLLLVHDTDIFHNALFANYGKKKPHFVFKGTELVLQGIPVPREAATEAGAAREAGEGIVAVKKSILSNSRLYALLSSRLKRIALLKKLLANAGLVVPGRPIEADVALTGAIISRMNESAPELWVLLVPSQEVVSSYAPGPRFRIKEAEVIDREEAVREIKKLLERKGIGVVDLTPEFIGAAKRGDRLYFKSDNHWNREANRIAAEKIAAAWRKISTN
jgi:lysophospholipase L1-like esterase